VMIRGYTGLPYGPGTGYVEIELDPFRGTPTARDFIL
jgi:hypothetical protein